MYDLSHESTENIRHDLAMMYTDNDYDDLVSAMEAELHKRGIPLPQECHWEYEYTAYRSKKLVYT